MRCLPKTLQAQFDKEFAEEVELAMMTTVTGRAVKFVQALLDLHETIQGHEAGQPPIISTAAVADDLVWLVKRMIVKRDEHQSKQICTHVDLGYHYTQHGNLERIRTDGLLSLKERTERKIQSNYNGSQCGDGIYTCSDPTSYRSYGPVGLLVARLKGTTASVVSDETYAVGNLVVLRSCEQCVPLVQFTSEPCELLRRYHSTLQSLIDTFFNGTAAVDTSDGVTRGAPQATPY
jgi:hypothetical protein